MLKIAKIILEREQMRVLIEEYEKFTEEIIEVKNNNTWVPILKNFNGNSTLRVWSNKRIFSKSLNYLKRTKKKTYYQLDDEDFKLNLDYCLEEDNILHIRYKLLNKRDITFSKLIVNYEILLGKNPDYTWVPHLVPKENFVIGDHVFRSPVIIYKKGNISFAFFPDLKTLGQNRPFQTFLDLNLHPEDDNLPEMSFGYGNYKPYKHVYFKHRPSYEYEVKKNTNLTFRYYIIAFNEKNVKEILEYINHFFWEKYGRRAFYESINPQVVPYEINVKEAFKAIFERHNFWGNFKINNVECGGFWQQSGVGKNKLPIKFIQPKEMQTFKKQRFYSPGTAVIWNNAWFSNIRSSYGLRFFGEKWSDMNYLEKAEKMLNTVLFLPDINGIFPSLILPAGYNSDEYSIVNGVHAFFCLEDFNVVDASLTMYWTIKLFQDFGGNEQRIRQKCKQLAHLLKEIQLENGAIPIIINFNQETNAPIIKEDLIDSASSGAPLMFLLEYYKISRDKEIIEVCEKISQYIENEIIPDDKWHDFEAFYSCTYPPPFNYDNNSKSHIKNNLCIYWCAESFKELYKITKKIEYLKLGEQILATLSLFQQVWNMPYISIDTFGGFGVQNADAELNDARQALFVKTYMEYYLETGKYEYMERGIAALRASWVTQMIPEFKEICSGNLKGLDTVDGIDKGILFENYGHSGKDQRNRGIVNLDWGNGSAAYATAYAKKHFGDLFIDFKGQFIFGIDGILMKKFDFIEEKVFIEFDIIPKKNTILIKARDSPEHGCELILNRKSFGNFEKSSLNNGFNLDI
ncbi:MAG: hypothetical protein ACFFDK_08560 [Promethearchaeota archaeon]